MFILLTYFSDMFIIFCIPAESCDNEKETHVMAMKYMSDFAKFRSEVAPLRIETATMALLFFKMLVGIALWRKRL